MESLNVVNDQTNVTTPSPTKSRYLDLAQQRQLQTPARPEPEEKRQVPDMEPIWQETTAKQKLNAQLRNRVSEPNTVEPQANDKEESEVIDEIQSPPVQEQVAEPTENVVNEPQPEVITVQAVQMDIKPTKAVPVQKQAPQIDTKPSKADPERKQALDNFLRPTSPPRQSKTDRSAATDLSYNSKFYLPEKYSMPKRVKPSVNTTFVRMRQNDEGTIVMLPKVASADFFAFKNSLREGVDVQPIPYERLNEIIPGFTNQIADQLKEELSTTHPSKTIQSESKILGNMYPVNAEEEVKVKQPVKERKSPSPKKRSQSPASQPAFIQQDVTPSGDNFTKGDIQELKALSKPPVAVKDVVSMVCILTTGNLNPDWQSCQKMLNNPTEFVKQLKEFDVGNITEEQIAKCRKVIGTNLTPDSVRSVSRAASGMFEWVCSIVGLPEQAPAQVRVKKPVEKTKRQKSPSPAKAPKRPQQETESIFDADPSGDARRQHVTRGDITELKSLPNPPEAVKETLQIVCILLTGNLKPEWADCKKLIANPAQFIENMKHFDDRNLSDKLRKVAMRYIKPGFTPAELRKRSAAAAGMCEWVLSVLGVPEQATDEVKVSKPAEETKMQEAFASMQPPTRTPQESSSSQPVIASNQYVTEADLNELRSIANPSCTEKYVVMLACGLLYTDLLDDWGCFKALLDNPSFLKDIQDRDIASIDEDSIDTCKLIISNRNMSYDQVSKENKAAAALYQWVTYVFDQRAPEQEDEEIQITPKNEEVEVSKPAEETKLQEAPAPMKPPKRIPQESPSVSNLSVTKADVQELKSLKSPPVAVKSVLQMACILLYGNMISDWRDCQAMLGNASFLKNIQDLDVASISDPKIDACDRIIRENNISYDQVSKVSKAAAGLYRWVAYVIDPEEPDQEDEEVQITPQNEEEPFIKYDADEEMELAFKQNDVEPMSREQIKDAINDITAAAPGKLKSRI